MFEQSTQTQSRWRTFWPDVSDRNGALEAIKLGYGACVALAASTWSWRGFSQAALRAGFF